MTTSENTQGENRTLFFNYSGRNINVALFPIVRNSKELSQLVDQKPVIARYLLHVATFDVQWRSKNPMNIFIAHG